jgi:lysophospholipase L1-like esterase
MIKLIVATLVLSLFISLAAPAQTQPAYQRDPAPSATQPSIKNPERHAQFLQMAKKGNIDLLFVGDSITDLWRYAGFGKTIWDKTFEPLKTANFGIGGDRTQHVLWRMQNGELAGFKAKCIVLLIGTNNLSLPNPNAPNAAMPNSPHETAEGIKLIVATIRSRQPIAKILLLGVFPRGAAANDPYRAAIQDLNTEISKLDDGRHVFYLDIGPKFLAPDGTLAPEIMPDALHPSEKGYQIWADAILPKIKELTGIQ